ncbi:hypothetical protein V6x_09910 [Gimesia chilikensis]|uniref:Uncharacterized protein n=1 Tax=Gimesia chilikensis TaxID=2605989 RepID=A0A517W7T0_9PLAN|nr:hypothetical protein [Gimesia chilikensis]QDU01312.1 hypothetical protein V6x_09910 [Gimesia chilikensis]
MSYNLSEFLEKAPYDTEVCPFDDHSGRAVFAARWYDFEFNNPLEFHIFLYRFSCVLQPYIQGIRGDELEDFFFPDSDATTQATREHESHHFQDLEAIHWMYRDLNFVKIPWLQDYEHSKSMELPGDDFPELLAFGKAGYLTIFVADEVA